MNYFNATPATVFGKMLRYFPELMAPQNRPMRSTERGMSLAEAKAKLNQLRRVLPHRLTCIRIRPAKQGAFSVSFAHAPTRCPNSRLVRSMRRSALSIKFTSARPLQTVGFETARC